jgi:hypothetical protein
MTEAEWETSDWPEGMLRVIRQTISVRKLRLYACACCRRVWQWLPDERSRKAVEVSERYADGLATEEELSAAQQKATEALRDAAIDCRRLELLGHPGFTGLRGAEKTAAEPRWYLAVKRLEAARAAKAVARPTRRRSTIVEELVQAAGRALGTGAVGQTVQEIRQYRLWYSSTLRCVVGNPFRPAVVPGPWRGATVVGIARGIYEDRAFDGLPVLADALEEAGCASAEILNHCRGPGNHVRGCWVLDLLLARS